MEKSLKIISGGFFFKGKILIMKYLISDVSYLASIIIIIQKKLSSCHIIYIQT